MRTKNPLDEAEHIALVRETRARGVAPVARELGVPRTSLAAVLARVARAGTEAVVALRIAERRVMRGER